MIQTLYQPSYLTGMLWITSSIGVPSFLSCWLAREFLAHSKYANENPLERIFIEWNSWQLKPGA